MFQATGGNCAKCSHIRKMKWRVDVAGPPNLSSSHPRSLVPRPKCLLFTRSPFDSGCTNKRDVTSQGTWSPSSHLLRYPDRLVWAPPDGAWSILAKSEILAGFPGPDTATTPNEFRAKDLPSRRGTVCLARTSGRWVVSSSHSHEALLQAAHTVLIQRSLGSIPSPFSADFERKSVPATTTPSR